MCDPTFEPIGPARLDPRETEHETSEVVFQVQKALNLISSRLAVPETGLFDRRTQEVLRRFQEQEDLPQTGAIDPRTIEALNRRAAWAARECDPENDVEVCEEDVGGETADGWAGSDRLCRSPGDRAETGFFAARYRDAAGLEAGLRRESLDIYQGAGWRVRLQGQAAAAGASVGTRNADGSRGAHAGAEATVVGAQIDVEIPGGESASVGLSAGPSAAFSFGVRDADLDGRPEACVRVAVGPVTIAGCAEQQPGPSRRRR